MSDFWFRPKTHGYGATPLNWKGWAVTCAFLMAIGLLTLPLLLWPELTPSERPSWLLGAYLVANAVLTIWFVRLCRTKTDGEWRWRWDS